MRLALIRNTRGPAPRLAQMMGEPGAPITVVIHNYLRLWCMMSDMGRTNIEINEDLICKARKLTRLKTKRQIVDRALELLVRSESRKGILRYYGTGIWKGDLKASRRDRV
jgi:Arc/MetJ family transcription regulator